MRLASSGAVVLAGKSRDGLHSVLGEREVPVHHDDARARLGQQDGGRAAVADAVAGRPAPRHDRDLPHEPPVVPGVEIHACLLASALNAAGRIRPKRLRVKSGRATLLRIREMAAGK